MMRQSGFASFVIAATLVSAAALADSIQEWGSWNVAPIAATSPTAVSASRGGPTVVTRPTVNQAELVQAARADLLTPRPQPEPGFVNNGNWVGYAATSASGPTGAGFVTTFTWERTVLVIGNNFFQFVNGPGSPASPPTPDPRIAALIAQGYVQRGPVEWVLTYNTTETATEFGPNSGQGGSLTHKIRPTAQLASTSGGVPNYFGEVVQEIVVDGVRTNVNKPVVFSFPALNNGFWWSKDALFVNGESGVFVVGQPTPPGEIAALRAGNFSATYAGQASMYGHSVNIAVNFGAATWNGAWSGGNLQAQNSTLIGGNNFTATGALTRTGIAGNVTGAGIRSGTVDGTFVGPNAATVLGKTDLRIDRLGGGTAARLTDVFAASRVTANPAGNGSGFEQSAGITFTVDGQRNPGVRLVGTERTMVINGQNFPVPAGK